MALEILRSDTDGITGHISVLVRAVEKSSSGEITKGPPETVGIEHSALMAMFHGPEPSTEATIDAAIVKWLANHHKLAISRKHAIESASGAVSKLKGRTISFAEEVSK